MASRRDQCHLWVLDGGDRPMERPLVHLDARRDL